jgi:hypothetical protein
MALNAAKLPDLIIPSGTNVSNIWKAREIYEDAEDIELLADSVVDGVITYTLEITNDFEPSAGGFWATLQDAAADVAPPLTGKSKALPREALSATGIRVKSSANVTANRNWRASKRYGAFQEFSS